MLPRINTVFDRKNEIKGGAADGLLQIEVYDTVSRQRKYFAVCRIDAKGWNSTQKKVVEKNLTDLQIETIRRVKSKIDELVLDCSRSGVVFTLEWLQKQYTGGYDRHNFVDYFARERLILKVEDSTKANYKCTLNHLQVFSKNLQFGGVTVDWVARFRAYLSERLSESSVIRSLTHVKSMYGRAVKQRLFVPVHNPFDGLQLTIKPTDSVKYLELDEFLRLEGFTGAAAISKKNGQVVFDMYLFSCFTGLRYSDVSQLTSEHFTKDKDGNVWFSKVLQKSKRTGKVLKFCLTDFLDNKALRLYEKYNVLPTKTLFPKICNQQMNIIVTKIFKACGISEELTYHSSRHTFAMLLYNESNLPLEHVQYLLGHSNIKTTVVYAKMKDKKIMNLTRGVTFGGPTAATATTHNQPITMPKAATTT